MAISRVEIKDFLVFKGEFAADFCPGVNVLIGANATGKTTLLKVMYAVAQNSAAYISDVDKYMQEKGHGSGGWYDYFTGTRPGYHVFDFNVFGRIQVVANGDRYGWISDMDLIERLIGLPEGVPPGKMLPIFENGAKQMSDQPFNKSLFIPSNEILSHSLGLLALNNLREIPFDKTYIDIVSNAELGEAKNLSLTCNKLVGIISQIIEGEVIYQNDMFYIKKPSGQLVEFSFEASGYRKLGLLWKLIRNGLLEPGTVLFWDEPENSLNPELVPKLVDILLELAKTGVQIFLATHDYNLARYFDVRKDRSVPVAFHNLRKADDGHVECSSSAEYIKLPNNLLEKASADLFDAVVDAAMEVQDDE